MVGADAKPAAKSPASTVDILRRNPEACKAILVCGLLVVIQNVPTTLVVNSLQAQVWGHHMAEYSAAVNLALYTIAIFFTGPMGRLGDTHGNKLAVTVVAVLACLPTLSLLVFGQNQLGLTVWAVARVMSGMGGASMSGSPAIYALVNEVSAKDDMEVMLGITFAGTAFLWMVMNFVGVGITLGTGSSQIFLLFMLALVILLMLCIAWIRSSAQTEESPEAPSSGTEVSGERDLESQSNLSDGAADTAVTENVAKDEKRPCLLIASLKFAFEHRALTIICFVAALVCIPENVLFDVQIQFAYGVLGLLGDGKEGEGAVSKAVAAEQTKIAFGTVVAIQMALMLGSIVVSQLSKRISARRLLIWVIPVVAVLQALPALSVFAKHAAMAIGCGAMLGFSLCLLPPLQAVTIHVAPPGRVSEAIGAMGAFKSLSSLLGNLIVTVVVPLLQRTGLKHPLWVLYPSCAVLSLVAILLLAMLPASANGLEQDTDSDATLKKQASAAETNLSEEPSADVCTDVESGDDQDEELISEVSVSSYGVEHTVSHQASGLESDFGSGFASSISPCEAGFKI